MLSQTSEQFGQAAFLPRERSYGAVWSLIVRGSPRRVNLHAKAIGARKKSNSKPIVGQHCWNTGIHCARIDLAHKMLSGTLHIRLKAIQPAGETERGPS